MADIMPLRQEAPAHHREAHSHHSTLRSEECGPAASSQGLTVVKGSRKPLSVADLSLLPAGMTLESAIK